MYTGYGLHPVLMHKKTDCMFITVDTRCFPLAATIASGQ